MTVICPIVEPSPYSPDTSQLRCPFCNDEYVHVEVTRAVHEVTDDYTAPIGTRGPWIAIPCWCENGHHAWKLVLGFHKSMTFIGVVDNPEGWPWPVDDRAA